ncbi:hypothetical protein [Lacibacter sp. H407]|uniref:hypothetical protein n=1 Tax=Lacibacter sp. H407 TaxID=3133423 RepID=UPI0030BF13D6
MTTAFKILFTVDVLHDFYKEGNCTDFRFVPAAQTRLLLANHQALFKTVGNRLIVLIKCDETGRPFIPIAATAKFSFNLELMKPLFMTVSNLELQTLASKRFYFTNLHQNKVNVAVNTNVLYLSNSIDSYNGATNYLPGDFVKHAGIVYECIKESTGNTPPVAGFWVSRENHQYASKNDMLQFITDQQNFTVSPDADQVVINVFQLNTATDLFDELVFEQVLNFEAPIKTVSVDLSKLPDATYRLMINAEERMVYKSNEAVYRNMFGVVELFNHLANGNEFAFFDAGGLLKDQFINGKNIWLNYTIRFANRLAYWTYLTPKKGVQVIDGNPKYSFTGNANPADFFTSAQPIPLTEKPHEFKLTLFQPVSSEPPLAPNPDVHASGMLSRKGTDYYCNIYLNY